MKQPSRILKISILLAVLFGLDKALGILRYLIIGREFGLSRELDVFNAANNVPDLLFALISGGALAIAFIPVLSEVLTNEGHTAAWKLFSRIINLAFLLTAVASIIIAFLAKLLVSSQLGIAPGFSSDQQALTTNLMRLNLIATLIFSISGLVMAGLQANQHFLFPALAPIFYDLGQIFGATVLAPMEGYKLGNFQLPAFGLGVSGLVYGVILGAVLHLAIQVPGLIKYHFKWSPEIRLNDPSVRKVIALMGPRLLSVLAFNLIFIAQDNLASRLAEGSITALTFGWLIMQVPETLIGTAIATALLPTLSEYANSEVWDKFKQSFSNAVKTFLILTIPIAAILGAGLFHLIQAGFNYDLADTNAIVWTTRAFLLGLVGHSLVEIGVRSFYARQNAKIPLFGSLISLIFFILLALVFMRFWDAPGIALANSLAYTLQALFLLWKSRNYLIGEKRLWGTLAKSLLVSVLVGSLVWILNDQDMYSLPNLIVAIASMGAGTVLAGLLLLKDLKEIE